MKLKCGGGGFAKVSKVIVDTRTHTQQRDLQKISVRSNSSSV